jgi:CubicO group peptidase (beta-lactamase class C family)
VTKIRHTNWALAAALIFCLGLNAAAKEESTLAPTSESVRKTVETGIEKGYFAGAVVLAGRQDQILLHEAFGNSQVLPKKIPMQKDAVFDLASVTKVVATTTACAVCIDEGLVDLDRPARQYLPGLNGEGAERVKVRQLGMHTSGFDNKKFAPDVRGDAMLRAMQAASPHDPPGSRYQYSCPNFILLSLLVEDVTKQPFSAFCKDRIFGPLGMKDTRFGPVPAREQVVAMKGPVGQISDAQARLAGKPVGNAGLFSTAADLARFCQMMLGEGELGHARVLSRSVVEEITHEPSTSHVGRGFGWDLRPEGRPRGLSNATYYHTGWTGQSMWIDPEQKLYVIVLTNRNHPKERPSLYDDAKRFRIRIAESALDQVGSGRRTDPE